MRKLILSLIVLIFIIAPAFAQDEICNMKATFLTASIALAVLSVAYQLPALAEKEVGSPEIPGTSTSVKELFRDLAWDFDVERSEDCERRTLDWDEEGPAATHVISYYMKSKRPHRRTNEGALYLGFALTSYEFENEATALHALDAFKRWHLRIAPAEGMMCKGAVYRVQKGPFLYVLVVGCQFSRHNYDVLVGKLESVLKKVNAGDGYAIQCYCGGGWVERTLVSRGKDGS